MSTDAQIFANRGNGLSAGFRVLTNENQEEFDELIAEYHRTFAPTTTYERFLVEEMVQARWRLARVRRLEAAVFEQMVGLAGPADADAILAAALIDNAAGSFLALQRYAAAAERTGYRALKQLLALRKLEAQAARDTARRNEANPGLSPDSHPASADESPHSEVTDNNPPFAAETRRASHHRGRVRQYADARHPDGHHVAGGQRGLAWNDDARPGEQHRPRRHRVAPQQKLHQRVESPLQ